MAAEQGPLTYAATGVDVDTEAKAAATLYRASQATWQNRADQLGKIVVPYDDFSGLRFIKVGGLPESAVAYGNSDGIGTKSEIAERADKFNSVAFDLMAMLCDDAAVKGAEPVWVKSVLVVNTLGNDERRLRFINEMCEGYEAAAWEAGVTVINGEIAQHNDRMGDLGKFHFDWSGDVTWFADRSRLISGHKVQPEDLLIGLQEPEFRCNGFSLLRRALKDMYGENWEDIQFNGQRLVDVALTPSRIYTRAVVEMTGGWSLQRPAQAELHGAAHITGGGIPEKLGRALRPSGYGAIVDDPFDPSDLMLHCQNAGITDDEAYRAWNMGQGMVLITPESDNIIQIAEEFGIDAKVIGRVKEEPGITIYSKGLQQEELHY